MADNYPKVLDEFETLELAHSGISLARYGDGEYNHCFGKRNVSQTADKSLTRELLDVLASNDPRVLPCIPNIFSDTPKQKNWMGYAGPEYLQLFRGRSTAYGSSFITRPDSAPWIDTPAFWDRVRDLWRGKDAVLAIGTERSLRVSMMPDAASVRVVQCPSGQRDDCAYAAIDRIEEEIGRPAGPVILCLGPTATVLAPRLARKGVHALDLGHIGMFMRSAGAYRYTLSDLISEPYRQQLIRKHESGKWGGDGAKHADAVRAYAAQLQTETILDYGCGEQQLAEAMKPLRVQGFDPGIRGREGMPKPCDLVVCADVLEHCERDKLDNVLGHLKSIMLKGAYLVIATRPAKAILPDGRNAHLIIEEPSWWIKVLITAGFIIDKTEVVEGKEVRLWVRK